jgi:hypothetical protein
MTLGTLKEIKHVRTVLDHRTSDLRLSNNADRLTPKLLRLAVLRRLHVIYGHERLHRIALTLGVDSLAKVKTSVLVLILKLLEGLSDENES